LDTSQLIAFMFLIAAVIVAIFLWLWEWRHLIAVRLRGTVGVMTLKDAVIFVLLCPVTLTGSVGAVWIYFKGWEDFTRIILVCISFGFLMGGITALLFYIMNRASLRMMKTEKLQTN
jgi:hypothetical protein